MLLVIPTCGEKPIAMADSIQQRAISPQTAKELVLNTMAGSIELAMASNESVETLRNSVTSKNGTTAAGLTALMQDSTLENLVQSTVSAAYERAVALR